jgi:putative addiction module CopG family antidote
MEITLSPASEKIVRHKLESGSFDSADDVILAALELLQNQEKDWAAKIEEGWKQAEAGQLQTPEQVNKNLAKRKAQWRASRNRE